MLVNKSQIKFPLFFQNLPYQVFGTRQSGDATKTGRSVLKFSVESATSGPGARKSPKNGKPENQRGVIPPFITVIIP